MIIFLENARQWYDNCCKKIQYKKKGKILIFVSQTIDSLTSLRILVSLFQTDIIPYEIIPVQNYHELEDKLNQNEKSKVLLLGIVIINCLGDNDLSNFWFCKETMSDFNCLVVDSRRPSNHKNINDQRKIIIINDDYYNFRCCPSNEEMDDIINDEPIEEEKVPEDDGEAHYGDQNKGKDGKRHIKKKKNDLDINVDDGEDENDDQNVDDIALSTISEKSKVNDNERKKHERMKKRRMIEEYYCGSYYGYPSTYIFYSIATQLHRENTKFLWYLIVALTDEYLRCHFSQKQYDSLYKMCHDEVLKMTKKKKTSSSDDQSRFRSTGKDVNTIVIESDYLLYLYRHWTLFESFLNSYYPLGLFSAWREQGKEEIKKLFTYLGLPLTEATQKYRFMKSQYKNSFKNNIMDMSTKFELSKLLFLSFVYQFDKNTELSASDCVYLLSALLEYPFDKINDLDIEDDDNYIENESNEQEDIEETKKTATKDNKLKRFWLAYSFLSLKKLNMTNDLINLAIEFQKALARAATNIIEKKTFAEAKSFRYSIINSNQTDESNYFLLPGNLELLSLFIMQLFKLTHSKRYDSKPYLVAMFDEKNKTYLLKGVIGCSRETDDQRNEFGIKYKYTSKTTGIQINYEHNYDDLITIPKDYLCAFIQELSTL